MQKFTLLICLLLVSITSLIAKSSPSYMAFDICYDESETVEKLIFNGNISILSPMTIETDDCASAVLLASDGSVTDNGTNLGSGEEAGEPIPAPLVAPINSVWYQFTTTGTNSSVVIDFTLGTIIDPVVAIYEDACPPVAAAFFEQQVSASGPFTACLPAGTYRLQIATDGSGTVGDYMINILANNSASPLNEDCSGASNNPVVNGSNVGLDNICSIDGMVWFEYTVIAGDHVSFSTPTAGFSIGQVFLDDCVTPVTATTCLQAGDIIHIEAGDPTPSYGNFDLDISETDNLEPNDDCADAGSAIGALNCSNTLSGSGSNSACPDLEATAGCSGQGVEGVWYTFTVDGLVTTFDITGTFFEVFTGGCGALTPFGCAGDASLTGIDPSISGTNYAVLVFDDGATSGSFTAQANPSTPGNDLCSSASSFVIGEATNVVGNNSCATPPPTAFCNASTSGDHAVWYEYTTPAGNTSTNVTFTYSGTSTANPAATDIGVGVYDVCNGALLFSSCNSSGDVFECVLPNTTFIIGVGSQDGGEGEFTISIDADDTGIPANDLCDQAIDITPLLDCDWSLVSGDNTNACPESYNGGCNQTNDPTTWYSIMLPGNAVGIDVRGLNNANLEVFNNDCADPAVGPSNPQGCVSGNSFIPLAGGNTYLISVTNAGSAFDFEIRTKVPPTNDDCTTPGVLSLGSPISGTTECATFTAGENAAGCDGSPENLVWYTYNVANDTKTLTLSITNFSTGTINVAAWDGCNSNNYYNNDNNNEQCGSSISLDIDCPIAGTTIYFAVSSTQIEEGSFDIEITETQVIVPPNDDCANASLSNGPTCEVYQTAVGNNEFACPEPFAGGCGLDQEEVVWYEVQLPADATDMDLGINNYGGAGTPFFQVFTDCAGSSLDGSCYSNVSSGDPVAGGVNLDISGQAGSSIFIAFGSQGDTGGSHQLDIKINNTPLNDDPCMPEVVAGGGGTFPGSTECATGDFFDPACQPNYENTVWYEYTLGGGETGVEVEVIAGTATGPFGVAIVDQMGDCTSAPTIFTDASSCAGETEVVRAVCLPPGQIVHIIVATADASSGTFDITITPITPNPTCIDNDECVNAQDLGQITTDAMCTIVSDCNENACPDVVGSCNGGLPVNNVVWYTVQNDGSGDFISVEVTNATFNAPVIGVFVGPDCNSLTQLGPCTTGGGNNASTGPIDIDPANPPIAGENYYIAIGTDGPLGGDFDLCIEIIGGCVNDDPCDAVQLSDGVTVTNPASTENCTPDLTTPNCPGADLNTVWYKFTMPPGTSTLTVEVNTITTTGDVSIQVGEYIPGNPQCGMQNTPIDDFCGDGYLRLIIPCLEENVEYYVQIGSATAMDAGEFDVTATANPPTVMNDLCSQAQSNAAYQIAIDPADYCQFVTVSGTTVDACPDDVVSGGCDYNNGGTVWYQVTIPNDPAISLMDILLEDITQGGGQFSLFDNNCDPLTPIAGADCGTSGELTTNVPVNPGDVYLIAIGTGNDTPGTFDFSVKVIAPPGNDLCANAEVINVGGGTTGTTECATNSMDYNFSGCATTLNESDVWYEIPITADQSVITVDITGFTGAGNYGAAAFYSTGGCGGLDAAVVEGVVVEDCAGDKTLEIPVKCLDPAITSIYIKVGSPQDDGEAGNGSEQGMFNISVTNQDPSCAYADECDDITEVLTPETPPDGTVIYSACAAGCLEYACPETVVGDCGFDMNPTVWFQVDTDMDAQQLYINVTTGGSWTPVFAIYQGDCSNLTIVSGGTVAEPINCNTDDTTPDVSNVGIQTDANGDPITTYYIAVSADGVVDDPNFDICAATAVGTVTCLGGIAPDNLNHTCQPAAVFEVTGRSNDPDGSLGLDLEGPFCPGETIDLNFQFTYDATATGNDWLQGIVPTFGEAIDVTQFDPTAITVAPGGAQWFPEGIPQVNENVPNLCTYTNADGLLVLCNTLCEVCPCNGPLTENSPLPGGWFWVTNGGGGCANDGTPTTMYGIPGGVVVAVEFDLQLTVKEFADAVECAMLQDEFTFSLQTFSDGVTGCWEDPTAECLKDVNQVINFPIECELPPGVTANPNPKEICTGEDINVTVTTDDGSNLEIDVMVEDNPNVDGENNHTFFGSGVINDVLINNSGTVQTVLYIMRAIDPTIVCPGPLDTLEVTIYPELLVEFDDVFVCEFQCTDITPTSITGGSSNYTTFEWSTGETGVQTINVCPLVPTTYILTVTDDKGCTGTGEVEVDVKPKVKSLFDPAELFVCQDGVLGNDELITVVITDGSPVYFFDWSFSPFGLEGNVSNDFVVFNGDSYEIEAEESFESFVGPYEICVEIVDMFGCADTSCVDVTIQGTPDGMLDLAAPLECGQTIVDLIATFDQGTSINGLDRYELYDCDGAFIGVSSSTVATFEDLDLEDNDCFILYTYNVVGCVDYDTLQLQITTGEEAIVDGDSTICLGDNASIAVTNEVVFNNPTYIWSNSLNTPSIIVSPDTTTTYIVTVTDDAGCSDIASFEVVVNDPPSIQITGSTSYCVGSSTTLMALGGTGATYLWTDNGGAPVSSTSSVTISSPGDYTIEVTLEGCTSDSTITITEDATLNINLNNPSLCDNSADTLFAGSGFDTYSWTFNNTTIAGEDTSFIEITQEGSYAVSVTDITGCSGVDTVMIANFQTPMAIVTDSIEVCRDDNGIGPVTINFNDQVTGTTGTWADTDLSGVDLSDLTSVSFEGITRDTYSFTFTTNTAMGNCSNVSYVMEVIVVRCPCPIVATRAIPDQCNDTGNIVDLNEYLTSPTIQVGSWTFISGPSALTVVNDSLDLSGAMAGMYTVRWTLETPVGTCPEFTEQTFEVFEAPFAEIVPGAKTLCNADTGQGPVEVDLNTYLVPGSASGTWSQQSGPAVAGLPLVNGEGLAAGDVLVFTYTTNSATAPCTDIDIDVTITIRDCNCPFVEIDPLPSLCNSGGTINLDDYLTTDPVGLAGTWSVNISPSPISGSNLDPTGLLSGQYVVTYTLTNDPGPNCTREFTQDLFIRRQPTAVVIGSGSPCNANSSGTDITTVDLFTLLANNPSPGSWSQTGGTPSLTIDASGIVEFDGQPIGSTFEFTYTTTNAIDPCVNISVPVSVTVVDCNCPNIDINPAGPLCNTEIDLDLSTLEGPIIEAGSWSVNGPSGPVVLTGSVLTILDLPAGNYDLTYTLDTPPNGSCQADTTQVLVIEEQRTAQVLPNGEACSEDQGGNENVIDLFDLVTGGATDGTWFDPNGDEFAIPNFADFAQYNPGDIVNITYVVTSNAPCMDLTYPVAIEILDCQCPTIVVTDIEVCSADGVIDLTASGDPNKPGGFESTEVAITNGSVDVTDLNGNYTIDYVIDSPEPGCPDRRSFVLTVIGALNPGVASATSLCVEENEVIDLFALLEGEDTGGVWTETSNQPSTGGAFDPNAGTFNTNNQAVGTYRFTYSFTNNSPCPDVSSEVTVTIQNIPPVDAGEAQTLDCDLLFAQLGGTPGNNNFDYQWTHDGGTIVPNATDAQTQVNFPGVFTLTVTDRVTGCTSSDQVTIDLSSDRPDAELDMQDISCFGARDGSINVINVSGGTPPYQYSNNGGVTFQNSANFLNLNPGDYDIVLQDAGGCIIELGVITIVQPEELSLDLGQDQLVTLETRVPLSIEGQFDLDRITNIVWTVTTVDGDSVVCSTPMDCLTYEHFAEQNSTICVTISDDNGCETTDCININVVRVRDITFPQIFTPNNDDNINQTFFVNDNDVESVKRFFIYDRWGNKVFSAENTPPNDPAFGWNGTFNGKDAAQGVYVYLIEVVYVGDQGETEVFSGDITVLR